VIAYVLDASVVVKWFLPEPWSEAARRLRTPDLEVHSPDLLLLETSNAFWKHVVRGTLDVSVAREAVEALAVAPIFLWGAKPLFATAFELARETGRSVYDCTYLALAIQRALPLVTADRRFYDAIQLGAFARYLVWVEDVSDPTAKTS
jgi:predicted nucleic acid-binding protein